MPKLFSVKVGKVIGRGHLLVGKNCQDSFRIKTEVINDDTYYVAWISDGCSEGERSEVGAHLATQFLLNRSIELIKDDSLPLEAISIFLYDDLQKFLKTNLDSFGFTDPLQKVSYIKDHLLFTLIGFIIGPKHSLIMAFGDGLIILNNEIVLRDFNDESPYPAYHLIDPQYLNPNRRPIDDFFEIYPIDTQSITRLAIGSDAWLQEQDLLENIWGYQHPNQIQRFMNLWSERDKHLNDDATLIVVEPINT